VANLDAEAIVTQAMAALREGETERARELVSGALDLAPDRPDIMHALAVLQLQLGEPQIALQLLDQAEEVALAKASASDEALMAQLYLTRAAACEDNFDPGGAEDSFREVLANEPGHPRAMHGLGYLLIAWGRAAEGIKVLTEYVERGDEGEEYAQANGEFLSCVSRFAAADVHPREFLVAHRGAYVEFFDHHARAMEKQGWLAEAARMRRNANGDVVPLVPDGARPYAAVRVDLVDPATGQPGLVGDQPMVVALAGYEALSQAPALFDWPGHPFPLWVASQAPWNQLPIQLRFIDPVPAAMGAALATAFEAADKVIGDWYQAGFHGAFGTAERGRFHDISDPETPNPADGGLNYTVDCGRAELTAIDDLLRRLAVLHDRHPIGQVLIGRGFPPR
jgi:tetratricopeptide (TPR) repeat protein